MVLTDDEKEAFERSLQVLAAPNVTVAGGELAFRKYLAALDFLSYLKGRLTPEKLEEVQNG